MVRLMKESFIPVLLVIAAIFVLVYYSNYIADIDADQVTVIEIPATNMQQIDEQGNVLPDNESKEDELDNVAVMRVDDPVFEQAYSLLKEKRWNEAEQSYLALLKNNKSSQGRTDLAYVYYKKKDYDQALKEFSLALAQEPVYLAAYYYRAKTYYRMDRLSDSEQDYQFFIKYFPQHYYAHYRLGVVKFKQKHYQDAVDVFSTAAKLAPGKNKSKALNYLAKSYQRLGEGFYPRARDVYKASIRVSPGEIEARMGSASLLSDTDQGRADAEELYDQVLKLRPHEPRAYFNLAVIYNKQGGTQRAQNAYQKSIEFNPSYVAARYNLGLMLLERESWQEALDQFQAVINLEPDNARAYFNLGRSHYKLKSYQQALDNYQHALDIRKGDYPEVAINLGLIYIAKKDFDKAIDIYRAALLKDQSSAKLHYNLGLAYVKSGKTDAAMNSYLQAIKHKPGYAQAWYNIARIHSHNEQFQDAASAYKKALEIRPNYRSAQLNLAVALTRLTEFDQAEMVYRQVLSDSPRYFSAWVNLGLVLMDQQRYAEAEDVFYQASLLDTEDNRVVSLLARTYREQNKLAEAERYYRIVLDMKPGSKRYRLEYIRVLIQQEKYQKAILEAEKGIKLFPESKLMKKELNIAVKTQN